MLAHVLLAFLFLQLPKNDTIPQGVGRHTSLGAGVLCNCSFYWHHLGFDNDSMGRLKKVKYKFKKCWRIKGNHFSLASFREPVQKKAHGTWIFRKKAKKNCGVHCHTTLNRKVLRNLSFYWHHLGFYNDSKDRLQSKMTVAKGLRLLKSMFQGFLQHPIILAAYQSVVKFVEKMTMHWFRGQVVHV